MDESALRILLAKLEGSQSSFHWWLEFWTAMVAVGVVLEVVFVVWEYIEDLHDFRRGIVHPPERPSTLLLFLGLFGASLVAVGVSGEWYEEANIEHVETQIRKANDALYLLLSKEAGDAAQSARTAHEQVEVVSTEADALTNRMGVASRQLDQLDTRVATQGARAKLLTTFAPKLVKKLSPFARQRRSLFVCGQLGVTEQETIDTWAAIANILGTETISGVTGAKWNILPPNLNFAGNCGAAKGLGQGVIVFVGKYASKDTTEAANVLGHELAKALPTSPTKTPNLVDPDFAKLLVERGFQGKNAPWISPGFDPDLITILIGEHP